MDGTRLKLVEKVRVAGVRVTKMSLLLRRRPRLVKGDATLASRSAPNIVAPLGMHRQSEPRAAS